MDVGVTVGDAIERLERTAEDFERAELSIGVDAYEPGSEDERLERAVADANVALDVHLPFDQVVATAVPQLNGAIVDYQSELLAWAGSVGAEKAVLHATMRDPHDVDQRPVFADQLVAIADAGDDVGVEVVVENVGHQARGLPLSVLGEIASDTDTTVCFDVGHAYMEDGDDGVDRFLGDYADRVGHLHVHDVRGRGDTHLPLGAGEVDYEVVADHLVAFEDTVAVEVFTDDAALLGDTARRIQGYLDPQADADTSANADALTDADPTASERSER